jgi:dethiobiotin synthetase
MAGALLITGTDTGVGKTLVGCALASALAETYRVAVFKPAETGCRLVDGELVPEDALQLRAAARSDAALELVCPFRFAEPLAPWVAAERAGRAIDPDRIADCFRRLASFADFVIVETAGGLLVPLTRTYGYADLAADLELPLLVVVASRLGAINQTLLTVECARGRGLQVLGYVLNQVSAEGDVAQETNAEALARLVGAPCLGRVPYLAPPSGEKIGSVGEKLLERLFPALTRR